MSLPSWPLPDEQFQTLLADLRIGILLVVENEKIIQASRFMAHMLGYPKAENLLPVRVSALWVNEKNYYDFLFTLLDKKHVHGYETQLRCGDQRVIWAEISAQTVHDADGRVVYQIAIKDITEQKQMVSRSKSGEQRFRELIENTVDALVVLDAREQILYANPPFYAFAGAPSETFQGRYFTEFLRPDDVDLARLFFRNLRSRPDTRVPFAFHGFQKNGEWSSIEGTAINLMGKPFVQGNVLHFRNAANGVAKESGARQMEEPAGSNGAAPPAQEEQKRLYQMEEDLRFRADFEKLIIGLSARLINVNSDQINETLQNALAEVGTFEKVDGCNIFLFTPDLERMYCIAEWRHPTIRGGARDLSQNYTASEAPWWHNTLKALEPCYFSTVHEIPAGEETFRSNMQRMGIKSLIDVPIARKGKLAGFLRLSTIYTTHEWSEKEIDLQKLLVEIIANALERHEAEGRLNRQVQRMAALHTIDKTITSKTELRPVLGVLLEQVISQLGIDAADILLYDAHKGKITFGDGKGFRTENPGSRPDHLAQPILQEIIQQRRFRAITIPRQWQNLGHDEGFITYFGVPLIAHNEVRGILEIYQRAAIATADEWMLNLTMLSEQAAIAIDNVTMFQTLERSNKELSQAYDVTLEGWARALELRDQETEGHSRRVPWLALRLAKELNLGEEELVHLRRGALLHDIGKMGVPDSILSKTGPLNAEEWVIMRQHPVLAYNLLSSIPFLKPALDIPYCHHEKWDGTGYPRGLKGEEIPIGARIFAIVDVWDALRTARRYREAWEEPRVRAYMVEQSGKHFDPAIVQAFMRLLEQGTHTFD